MKKLEEYKLVVLFGCENYDSSRLNIFTEDYDVWLIHEESNNTVFFATKSRRIINKVVSNLSFKKIFIVSSHQEFLEANNSIIENKAWFNYFVICCTGKISENNLNSIIEDKFWRNRKLTRYGINKSIESGFLNLK